MHPALGVATGTGTDVAIETADVVLMSGERKGVINAVRISRATVRNIKENLGWAFGYNIPLIPAAAGVLYPAFGLLLSPTLASLAMAFSSVLVLWGFQSKTAVRSGRCTQTKAGQVQKRRRSLKAIWMILQPKLLTRTQCDQH